MTGRRAGLAGLVLAVGLVWAVRAGEPAAALTREQIEADWKRQDAVRGPGSVGRVTAAEDAAGGVDGVINGRWGFHTKHEANPWWQVDLGQSRHLGRVVLYNREELAERNGRIQVLLSDDSQQFRPVYQHDGRVFFGHRDKKPLVVPLDGASGRYVRLRLPGTSYFHLDEVEVYPAGEERNVARGRPCTQSSVSEWSVRHEAVGEPKDRTAETVRRGLMLGDDLAKRGVAVAGEVQALRDCEPRGADHEARAVVRRLALKNPLLDFDSILFVKSAPGRFPHMSDQFYGWWSRPGGGVFLLEGFKTGSPRLRCLTAALPEGNFLRPDLSWDGKKILFAYCRYYPHVADLKDKATKANLPEDAFYHVWEMNLDGSGLRRLTRGRYDDFDARYLPDGRIVFLSTRKGTHLPTTAAATARTATADLPDSYVRCGGDNYRPVPVFTLHVMGPDGGELRPLSAFENFEWTPAVADDGSILYTRWDYIDRFNGHFFSLWSTNPDGTNANLVYGNYTMRPQVKCEARPVPGSRKLIFTASAHHSILGGSLVLFDRTRGTEGDAPLERLTPEVPFPETEANAGSYYVNPWPLSEEHFLVSWSDRPLPPHCRVDDSERNPVNALGLYLYDRYGNLTLLYRDPAISSSNPIPVKPRPRPPAYASQGGAAGRAAVEEEGAFFLQDVSHGLEGVARGTVKSLRVVGVPPKVQPHMNTPSLGISAEDPGKFLLGTVPVEADGSAFFRAPAGVPVFFQALDADGLAVQTMRSLTYVAPGQTLSCVGCHESREAAPRPERPVALALRRPPSRLQPGPEGTWPLRFDRLVQPVLEKHCVGCHRPGGPGGREGAARLDLTAARSYDALLGWANGDLKRLAFEKDRSLALDGPARSSKVMTAVTGPEGHQGVRLDAAARERLAAWMDLYAQRLGHYSDEQERRLEELRRLWQPLLAP